MLLKKTRVIYNHSSSKVKILKWFVQSHVCQCCQTLLSDASRSKKRRKQTRSAAPLEAGVHKQAQHIWYVSSSGVQVMEIREAGHSFPRMTHCLTSLLTRGRYYLLRHSSLSGRPSPARHDISSILLSCSQSELHSIPRYQCPILQWRLPHAHHSFTPISSHSARREQAQSRVNPSLADRYEPR